MDLEATLLEDVEHLCISRHRIGGETIDPALPRNLCQMFEEQRPDTVALIRIQHRKRNLRGIRFLI